MNYHCFKIQEELWDAECLVKYNKWNSATQHNTPGCSKSAKVL